MPDILHRVGAEGSSPAEAYAALTTIDGLSGWWARNTTGSPTQDGTIAFRFVPGGIDMKVVELVPNQRVRWEVVGGPEEWIGTNVSFDLSQSEDFTIVMFKHTGWEETSEFMHHCSTKWGTFMISLKQLLETGAGLPDPIDVWIGDWH